MVTHFRDKYRFLSNFYPCEVWYGDSVNGATYPTTEHAYQAAKSLHIHERERIRLAETPAKAKELGRNLILRSDWEVYKLVVMEKLLRLKFKPDSELARRLLATGEEELMEGNTWGDRFWGCTPEYDDRNESYWKGNNHLGKLLMKIRKELKDAAICTATRS